MINQSEKGFELVILSDKHIKEFLEVMNDCDENSDEINIVWQMKFKNENFILYHKCKVSDPMNNYNPFAKTPEEKATPYGKKFKVTCESTSYYSTSRMYKNQKVRMSKTKYKDGALLERMLKISQLNVKSNQYEV